MSVISHIYLINDVFRTRFASGKGCNAPAVSLASPADTRISPRAVRGYRGERSEPREGGRGAELEKRARGADVGRPASGGCVAPLGERSEPQRAGRWAGTRAAPRSATGGNREPGRGVGLPTRGALARNDDRRTQPISYFPRGVDVGHKTPDGHDSSAHPRRMRIIAGRRDQVRRSCYLVRCLTRRAGRGVRSVQPLPTCDRAGRVEILPRREW